MSSAVFSAPGKLVVAGEYAVLDGFEALSLSVNRRVMVSRKPSTILNLHPSQNVVGCIVQEFSERGLSIPQVQLAIDSSALHLESNPLIKLGLGSSSAVAVAVTAVLLDALNIDAMGQLSFDIAQSAHQRFNRHRGSGIDIATCFYGGAIRFQRRGPLSAPHVMPCNLSIDPTCLIVVPTGIRQSTSAYLKRVKATKYRDNAAYREAIFGIGKAAELIINYLTSEDRTGRNWRDLVQAVREHNLSMQQLAQVCNIDILGDMHSRISAIAQRHDGAAKPSGAGGGDITLCFIETSKRKDFLLELSANSFTPLEITFCVAGVAS